VSRLWSRFGLRTLSVALLLAVLAGGLYLGRDDEPERTDDAAATSTADEQALVERAASRALATSRQRAAQREAAERAAEAAKAAALRARRVDEATQKKTESTEAGGGDAPSKPYTGPIPTSCAEFAGNRKIGCALMLERGFPIKEFPCLNKLWNRESGWNHKAENKSSGAYGIPQALPGRKMASTGADWRTNPATQIKWGLGYIKGRYGTPCKAWAHSEAEGWY
jgi:hypothetical protein